MLAHCVLRIRGVFVKERKKDLICDEMSDKIIEVAKNIATTEGAHVITVRRILSELGITNRVFYNRFKNIAEVLEIVYTNAVFKMHESIKTTYKPEMDFFEYVMEVAIKVLTDTYDVKMQFSRYMFEHDSLTQTNYNWWMQEIKKIIDNAKKEKLIKNIDSDMLSYSIWCFCRGFNADAVGRRLSKEDAIKNFKFGFGCILDGIKM